MGVERGGGRGRGWREVRRVERGWEGRGCERVEVVRGGCIDERVCD